MYDIVITPHAVRNLKKLPSDVLWDIDKAILTLRRPYACNITVLHSHALAYARLRVGNYRILFDIDDKAKTVVILKVRHRKDVYR